MVGVRRPVSASVSAARAFRGMRGPAVAGAAVVLVAGCAWPLLRSHPLAGVWAVAVACGYGWSGYVCSAQGRPRVTGWLAACGLLWAGSLVGAVHWAAVPAIACWVRAVGHAGGRRGDIGQWCSRSRRPSVAGPCNLAARLRAAWQWLSRARNRVGSHVFGAGGSAGFGAVGGYGRGWAGGGVGGPMVAGVGTPRLGDCRPGLVRGRGPGRCGCRRVAATIGAGCRFGAACTAGHSADGGGCAGHPTCRLG